MPPKATHKPLKICHLADIHLGYRRFNKLTKSGNNQREADVNIAFHEAVSRILSLKPDLVVIAGDIFHSVRPSNAILTFCFRELRRLAESLKCPIIVIAGNHESPRRTDTGSPLRLMSEIDGVYVADTERLVFSFPELDASVCAVPHSAIASLKENPPRPSDEFTHNILVTHGQIGGTWMSDFGGAEFNIEDLLPHQWDYVALGHVHQFQTIGLNVAYSGSVERTASDIWKEITKPCGFLEVVIPNAKITFHALTSPRTVIDAPVIDATTRDADEIYAAIKDIVEEIPGGLEGKIVRIQVLGVGRDVLRELPYKELRALRSQALHLIIDFKVNAAPLVNADLNDGGQPGNRIRLEKELLAFCEEWADPVIGAVRIKKHLSKIISDIEARDET